MEEVKNNLVSVSTRCQYLENKVAGKKDSTSDKLASTDNVVQLQNHLCEALEKNKQWLEYDQQREAYVRAILARMLWLEKQLNEANQARSQQHNEDHSHGEPEGQWEINNMVLLKGGDRMVGSYVTDQFMCRCEDSERDVKELKLQLKAERRSRKSSPEESCSEDDEKIHRYETEELLHKLDEEKRRSANAELQKNAEFFYQQSHSSFEMARPPSLPSRDILISSPHSSLLNESFLECPSCQAEYPVSHYRELLNHLEICVD
uniref:TSG101 and ALIX binding domain-containing protein n=1 Tax=Dicentrarchus labrax TaxID=13489 RepID=A0A8C4DL14_DICLA